MRGSPVLGPLASQVPVELPAGSGPAGAPGCSHSSWAEHGTLDVVEGKWTFAEPSGVGGASNLGSEGRGQPGGAGAEAEGEAGRAQGQGDSGGVSVLTPKWPWEAPEKRSLINDQ